MIAGRARHALPSRAAGFERSWALLPLLCACALAAGCQQDPVVVAGLQLEQDAATETAGNGGEPSAAGAAGDSPGDAGIAGAGGAAGMIGSAAPNCPVDPWFWVKLAIVRRDCKVRITDQDLLRALEEFQNNFPIEPSGEERMYEPCDYLAVWFYQNPNDEQEYIVCPSKCLLLNDQVNAMSEELRACLADAGVAP